MFGLQLQRLDLLSQLPLTDCHGVVVPGRLVAERAGLHPAASRAQWLDNLFRPGPGEVEGLAERRRVQASSGMGIPATEQQQVGVEAVAVLQGQQSVSRQRQSIHPIGEIPEGFVDGNNGSPAAGCAGCYCRGSSETMMV